MIVSCGDKWHKAKYRAVHHFVYVLCFLSNLGNDQ